MDNNKKELTDLAEKLIELMDSERGIQTKLANSVNKLPSSFSNIKRGKPVNADHLRAVAIVFGPEKLFEILSIEKNHKESIAVICENSSECGSQKPAHVEIIQRFKQADLARELNWNALKLEKLNPEALKEVNDFVKYQIHKYQADSKADNGDQADHDRRSGKDRRKSGT